MTINELLVELRQSKLALSTDGHDLVVEGDEQALSDAILIARVRDKKAELIEWVASGKYSSPVGDVIVPPNKIELQSRTIRPDQLPLISLTQGDIDRIVDTVPGGVANVQDIYALSPLQEGLLFHHRLATSGDPYLMVTQTTFADRFELDRCLAAVQRVVDRHDILRTAFHWDGLTTPAQVVWRQAKLDVVEIELDSEGGPAAEQVARLFDPREYRMDLAKAPLLRFFIAQEGASGRWVVVQLLHHLIGDHSSLDILEAEVDALLAGEESSLAAPKPYRNLVAQARLGTSVEAHERFFCEVLGDIDEPTLPFGLSDVHRDGRDLLQARRRLPQLLNDGLRKQARRLGVSLASLCHLAWGQVLARTSGRESVVFGSVLFGRMHGGAGADRAMGLFINTLPLRLDIDGTAVDVSVRKTHLQLAALLAHEHASLALAQRCSGVAPPAPLFSALLNYRHNRLSEADNSESSENESIESYTEERTNYPLSLSVEDFGDALGLTVQVVDCVSPRRVCDFMQRALEQLVVALETSPDQPVRELDVLPPAESELLLRTWNATDAPYPAERCIHDLFEEQVRKSSQAIAVIEGDAKLTYEQLNERANALAQRLMAAGVRPGDHVAVLLERSTALIVAELAVLKAGGAYVPVDPQTPVARQQWIFADSGAALVLTATPSVGSNIPTLSVESGDVAVRRSVNPGLSISSDRSAYVMYTSGSTGEPKGVVVPHRAVNRLVFNAGTGRLDPLDRVAWLGNPAFDISTFEVWAPLLHGAAVTVIAHSTVLQSDALRAVVRENVTVLHLTSGLFSQVAEKLGEVLRSVRMLLIGGDRVDAAVVTRVLEQYPPGEFRHCYGPTETTTFATTHVITDADRHCALPIGRPIANTRVYLLDGSGRPVPIGAEGELYIGGAGVAQGYLNRAELTAERFIEDPFCGRAGERMYRTGDRARYRADGILEFLGRVDEQVKIRGFRVEPGEIEARLRDHRAVDKAVVQAREDVPGDKRLVAYVTARAGSVLEVSELRDHLAAQLPEYMVPAAFVRLKDLPLTRNGKLDRRALPPPDGRALAIQAYEPPRGELEQLVSRIWAEVLGVERVGRNDHFFKLGGHSLLAVQVIERLRSAGLGVEIKTLFAQPVLAELASKLRGRSDVPVPLNLIGPDTSILTPELLPLIALRQSEIEQIVAAVPGGGANVQDIYSLSPLQDGILFHHVLATAGDPYLVPGQMVFANRSVLRRYLDAVQQVVDRHDILRTAVHWEGLSRPAQVVWRQAPLQVTEIELEGETEAAGDQLARRFDPRHIRIDLTKAPLLRFFVAQERGSDKWVMLELQHHLIGDHSTMEIMHQEVKTILAGKADTLAAPQPFRNLVATVCSGTSAEEHEQFFSDLLKEIDEPTLPFALSDVHGDGHGVVQRRRMLPQTLNDRLRAQARRLGVSLASLCHLAWGQVVARTSGRQSVVFGTVLLGRMQGVEGADRAMGLFMNTLPLRLDLDDSPVDENVRRTHMRLAELLRHEHASLALAQRCCGVAAPAPLFSALLNYRHIQAQEPAESDSPEGIEWLSGEERTNYPLTMSVDDFAEALGITAHVTETVSADRVCDYMQRALAQLADALETAPEMPTRQLDVLPEVERELMLREWNATQAAYPKERRVDELFEEQVRESPGRVAVRMGEEAITYGELNVQANRLARYLIARGVEAESRVAICMERSVRLVVGLLGILKAGGAYVPLDPEYPGERLGFMIGDARPVLTLSEVGRRLPADARVLCLDDEKEMSEIAKYSEGDLSEGRGEGRGEQAAYVIYTSGSTGKPKGAINHHRGVVNRLRWMQAAYGFDASDCFLQKTASSFDVSVWEFFCPLVSGATLVLAKPGGHKDPKYLAEVIRKQGVTTVHFVPSMMRAFLEEELAGQCVSLRRVICSGEALTPELQAKFYSTLGCELHNLYGPTEAAVDVTAWACRKGDESATVPIGRPIWNTQVWVLDARLEPVPIGVIGELYLGGAGLGRGYLGRTGMTAERFVANPFGEPGARMYRSGDLARYRSDGSLEYVGRSDNQVKLRGFRIELGEIETQLRAHPAVGEAVVVAREEGLEKRLVAYVTARPQSEVRVSELREYLKGQLPEYMVPAAIVALESLPQTPNGKLDRKALPQPDASALARRAYEAPQGEIEQLLAAIWSDLLGVDPISRHDQFFELGGHSLLALQFVAQARSRNLDCTLQDLFTTPGLAELGHRIAWRSAATADEGALAIRKDGSQLPVFFVPDELGDHTYAFELARDLATVLPIYALPWPSFREKSTRTVEAMAARMAGLIRSVRPHGPYRLVGDSSGGTLVHAIAQHLLGLDEPVSFLGLIELGFSPLKEDADKDTRSTFLERLRGASSPREIARIVRLESATRSLMVSALVQEARGLGFAPEGVEGVALFWEQVRAFAAACRNYSPMPLPLTVHLFQSAQRIRSSPDAIRIQRITAADDADTVGSRANGAPEPLEAPPLGWLDRRAARSIERHAISSDHDSVVTEERFQARLGASLSEALLQDGGGDRSVFQYQSLVPLSNTDWCRAHAFAIPGAGDGITSFNELARVLEFPVPLYGIQPRGIQADEVPHFSVEAAAASHVEAIRRRQLRDPIHLLGHSHGGLVAYEMARRMQGKGQEIASLCIIDSDPPAAAIGLRDIPDEEIRRAFVRAIERRYDLSLGIEGETQSGSVLPFLGRLHRAMADRGLISARTSAEILRGPLNTFSAACRSTYQPSSAYQGTVRLLLVRDPTLSVRGDQERRERVAAEWRKHAPHLNVSHGPGNHFTILGALHAPWLARWWSSSIEQKKRPPPRIRA